MPPEPRTSTRNKRPTAVPSGSVAAAARLAASTSRAAATTTTSTTTQDVADSAADTPPNGVARTRKQTRRGQPTADYDLAATAGQDSYLPEPPSGLQAGRSSPLNTLAGDSERQGTTGL